MAEDFRLETPEALEVAYDIAGIGTRFLAQLVDVIAIAGIIGVVATGVIFLAALGSGGTTVAEIVGVIAGFLIIFGYFTLYEAVWAGQTPGKRALQIRVIKLGGYPIGFLDSFIRNLVRLVDYLPSAYGVGIITMFISAQSRRLGDYAAGTIVVKERLGWLPSLPPAAQVQSEFAPAPVAGELDPDELAWNLHLLSARDLIVIAEFLERAPTLPSDVCARIGGQIASYVATRIGAREPLDPVRFLQRVHVLAAATRGR